MKFDVYCDESRPDLLSSKKPQSEFMVIGSLWLRTESRDQYKQAIHKLRDKHKVGGEFKWKKVSHSRQGFYIDLIEWFFNQGGQLRFRCIAVERKKVKLRKFHDSDQELGFYKFYYQMLHHWIFDWNEYQIFCDYKLNRRADRLPVLQRCLNNSNLSSTILNVQAVRSKESVLVQLADVLTGAVSAQLNKALNEGTAKSAVVSQIERNIGKRIGHSVKNEEKFNVFMIDLRGGW